MNISPHRLRSGYALVLILVLLLVASGLVGALVQAVMRDARQVRIDAQWMQAELLAEAALSQQNSIDNVTLPMPDGSDANVTSSVFANGSRRVTVTLGGSTPITLTRTRAAPSPTHR